MTLHEPTRIGIVGAGALGGLFGGYLSESGEDVVLVDRNEALIEEIGQNGLVIDLPDGKEMTAKPAVSTAPQDVPPVEILFLFVKAIHTDTAIQDALPMVDKNTIIVTVQNGLKNMEIIKEYVPFEQVVGGTTTEGSSVIDLGHVNHTGRGETKLGGKNSGAVESVAACLNRATIDTTIVDDPEAQIWEKQVVSVAIKPIAALTELLDGPLAEFEDTAWVMEQLVQEAVLIAESRGIKLSSEDPFETVREVCEVNYETKSSMLEDVQEHRKTEIDHINGAITEYGDKADIPTPFNEMAVALVKGKEKSYLD